LLLCNIVIPRYSRYLDLLSIGVRSISNVKVITDSTNCLPAELIKKLGIQVVPVGLVIEGKVYRDLIDITPEHFWKIFMTLKEPPSTSAGNPGDFLQSFLECGQAGNDMVCILVSKVLTATFESAFQARKMARTQHPEYNIEILDSHTSAGALGFVVLETARAAMEGKSLEEVIEVARDMISRVIYVSALDTLKYMAKIGRAPRGSSGLSEIFQVKPIIGFVDDSGYTDVLARVRGKQKSLEKLVAMVNEYADTTKTMHFMINYSNSLEDAEELKKLVLSKYQYSEIYMTEYSPVMCSATGPVIGLSFYS
jgi:DegV family protein with EDD domain